jgi:hypothetical protein
MSEQAKKSKNFHPAANKKNLGIPEAKFREGLHCAVRRKI